MKLTGAAAWRETTGCISAVVETHSEAGIAFRARDANRTIDRASSTLASAHNNPPAAATTARHVEPTQPRLAPPSDATHSNAPGASGSVGGNISARHSNAGQKARG